MVTQEELLKLIGEAAADECQELNLSLAELSELPSEIGQLTTLQSLDLRSNQLSTLPDSVGQLSTLQSLDLRSNQLSTLPDSVGQLTNLQTLYLSDNHLSVLPEVVGQLTNLQTLYLSSNHLSTLPDSVGQLTNLQTLYLSDNNLSVLPEIVGELTNLRTLYLRYNCLSTLPKNVGELTNLRTFHLRSNHLSVLPESVSQLTNLRTLDLRDNQLSNLPEWAKILERLDTLDLRNNPLPIPPEILGPKELWQAPSPASKTLDFYFALQTKEGASYLFEAKLILIGEGGAGKTSLAKKINNEGYALNNNEKSTKGIDVIRWDFPMADGNTFRTNIWDFGGQEIYHATHQFFLTKRSLYFLVADTRKENTDFYYWLKIVELLSDRSPVIIIKNEKQDRDCDIDEGLLKGQFNNLKDCLPTNLENNRGLTQIKDAIRYYIQRLPHVGNPLPTFWANVRTDLEASAKTQNTLTLQQYYKICERHDCTDKSRMFSISSYLHDLGVCLHFQEDKLLKRTLILRPEWATAAVYKVADSDTVRHNKGRFTDTDLANIWHEKQYADLRDELLQLMMRFKLAYEIPSDPGQYIAPQLLPISKPKYDWNSTDNIILRYHYDFMPKGILTRFIVETHQLINDQDTVWRNGVILADRWAKAEIIENYPKNEINIRVSGSNKKPLLEGVRYEFWKIHEAYERLEFQELIPCNCTQCKGTEHPEFYPYELLMRYIGKHQYDIECRRSFSRVDVCRLISDIVDSSTHRTENNNHTNTEPEYEAFRQSRAASNGPIINVNIGNANNTQVTIGNDNAVAQANVSLDADTQSLVQDLAALFENYSDEFNPNKEKGQTKIKDAILAEMQQKSTLQQRTTNALKAAGEQALIEVLNHPAAKITIKAIKAALDA